MTEAIEHNNQFTLYASTITPTEENNVADDSTNDDVLTLTGMASSNAKSLYGEMMNETALQRMCEDAVGLPILYDHVGEMGSVAGVVTNAYLDDNKLYITFNILPRFQAEIKELLEFGVNLGLSIGGLVSSFDKQNGRVEDISLVEISLTPVPANRDTHGTVMMKQGMVTGDCLYGVCNAIINENLKEDEIISNNTDLEEIQRAKPEEEEKPTGEANETPEENKEEDEPLTSDKVKEMIDEALAEKTKSIIETVLAEVDKKLNNKNEEQGEEKTVEQSAPSDVQVPIDVKLDADEIVEKLSAKIFDGLSERRTTANTKMEQSTQNTSTPKPGEVKRGMTPEEAARMMCRRIDDTDPITRAINESLNK